jgi:hypothetical protein
MDWLIGQIASLAYAGIAAVVGGIRAALAALWSLLTRFFGSAAEVFRWARTVMANWQEMVRRFLVASGNYARWLLFTRIPQVVTNLEHRLVTFVGQWFQAAVNEARTLFSTLQRWAVAAVNDLWHWITDFYHWTLDHIAAIIRDVQWLLDKVTQFLVHPSILAEWLAGAMWTALFNYAVSKQDAIGLWIRRKAVAATLWSASLLEHVISRVL